MKNKFKPKTTVKMRLHIDPNSYKTDKQIIMRKIISIKISGTWFHKEDFKTPLEIQKHFYEIIKDSGLFVQEVIYTDDECYCHDFFKGGKRHCIFGPTVLKIDKDGKKQENYFINDELYWDVKKWEKLPDVIRGKRGKKLERVLNGRQQ